MNYVIFYIVILPLWRTSKRTIYLNNCSVLCHRVNIIGLWSECIYSQVTVGSPAKKTGNSPQTSHHNLKDLWMTHAGSAESLFYANAFNRNVQRDAQNTVYLLYVLYLQHILSYTINMITWRARQYISWPVNRSLYWSQCKLYVQMCCKTSFLHSYLKSFFIIHTHTNQSDSIYCVAKPIL